MAEPYAKVLTIGTIVVRDSGVLRQLMGLLAECEAWDSYESEAGLSIKARPVTEREYAYHTMPIAERQKIPVGDFVEGLEPDPIYVKWQDLGWTKQHAYEGGRGTEAGGATSEVRYTWFRLDSINAMTQAQAVRYMELMGARRLEALHPDERTGLDSKLG